MLPLLIGVWPENVSLSSDSAPPGAPPQAESKQAPAISASSATEARTVVFFKSALNASTPRGLQGLLRNLGKTSLASAGCPPSRFAPVSRRGGRSRWRGSWSPYSGRLVPPAWGAPGASAAERAPHAKASRSVTVTAALQALERSGAITEALYRQYQGSYSAAKSSLRKLSGARAAELGAVMANVETMASKGQLITSRLPVIFTTLERNKQWWTTERLLGADQRVSFTGSRLVWEYYPGQGIEIQWLATFGEANGYFLDKETTALKEVLGEAIPLATQRAGGIAWEYMFQFDGGSPPWTSGLSQGTALQVLARAWSKTHEPQYLTAAQQALGIFKTGPQTGVRVSTAAGAHYLEYTYAPSERILNGFIQSLVGPLRIHEADRRPGWPRTIRGRRRRGARGGSPLQHGRLVDV